MSSLIGASDNRPRGSAAAAATTGESAMGTGAAVRARHNSCPERASAFTVTASTNRDAGGAASPPAVAVAMAAAAATTTNKTPLREAAAAFTAATSPLTPPNHDWKWDRQPPQSDKDDVVVPAAVAAAAAGRASPKNTAAKVQGLRLRQLVAEGASPVDTLVSPIETVSSLHRPGLYSPRSWRKLGQQRAHVAHSVKGSSADYSSWKNTADRSSWAQGIRRSTGERLLPSPWKRLSRPLPSPASSLGFGVAKPAAGVVSSEATRAAAVVAAAAATNDAGKAAAMEEKKQISRVSDETVKSLRNVRRLWERRASCDGGWDEALDAAEKQKDSGERELGRPPSEEIEKGLGVDSLKVGGESGDLHDFLLFFGWGWLLFDVVLVCFWSLCRKWS